MSAPEKLIGFKPPSIFDQTAVMDIILSERVSKLAAEAATLVLKRAYTDWPEDINAGGWKTHGVRWQDQDLLSDAPYLDEAVRLGGYAVKNAGYSMMLPGAEIKPHVGYTTDVVRYHFPVLAIDHPGCFIAQSREGHPMRKHIWRVGQGIVFDDTLEHFAQNKTSAVRVVVLIDFIRARMTLSL